ncbi:MAG TPA: DNA starvation/stationary phase protection protein Dps [Oligoflexia bacterium]|nr:DNA starvation/stationary phase protection protein Dps [Oligoflexia bacterium]HMP27359.1 DNA starvation/stationary phase protection protein Dps [Oligoflexia bacterium]
MAERRKTKIDISKNNALMIAKILNQTLADLSDLFTQLKQAHWNLQGANFIALHKFFDELAEEVEKAVDIVAERAVTLGYPAEGTARMAAASSRLPEFKSGFISDKNSIKLLIDRYALIAKNVRAAIEESESYGDLITADLFIDLGAMLDKSLWFLESHI